MSSTQTITFTAGTHAPLQLTLKHAVAGAVSAESSGSAVVAGSDGAIGSHTSTAPGSDSSAAADSARAQEAFLNAYPGYAATAALDALRADEYARLHGGETYLDYMGGALFPESLVHSHMRLLLEHGKLFGNAHSRSESSHRSSELAYAARAAVLDFLDADKDEYAVIFTPNATGALKMVGEAFPFAAGSSVVLPEDAHNSVHGTRVFAESRGADVRYYHCGERGGVDMDSFKSVLEGLDSTSPSLVVITGQSNVTAAKAPLAEMLRLTQDTSAQGRKVYTLLDAAALAPTSVFSLRKTPVDACAVSFYKICGYPTGLGALIVRRSFSRNVMRRVWFAGGTVTAVQVPGSGPNSFRLVQPPEDTDCPIAQNAFEQAAEDDHAPSDVDSEKWEDGTLNYLGIPAITAGLALVSRYRTILPERLTILTHYLSTGLERAKHANGSSLVRIVSTLPDLEKPGSSGAVVSCVFLDAAGTPIRNDIVERSARRARIAIRTGCMCNPGAVFGLLHRSGLFPKQLTASGQEVDLDWWQKNLHLGLDQEAGDILFRGDSSFGLVRISLGLVSNFADVWRVLQWVERDVAVLGHV